MLKWNLEELQKYKNHPLKFQEKMDLKTALKNRDDRIIDIEPIDVKGHLFFDRGLWYTDFVIVTVITVPSTRSLELVKLDLNDHITEAYQEDTEIDLEISDEEVVIDLDESGIDLEKAVADNILLSIPTQVLTDKEISEGNMPKGESWQVISEEDYFEKKDSPKPNPEFEKLKDLFKEDK